MTVIRLQDGKAIVEDGKVGIAAECCCEDGSVCCGPDCGVSFPVDFLPDAGMEAAFTAFLQGRGYANIVYAEDPGPGNASWFADCCKSDESDTDTFEVTGVGGATTFTVALCLSTKAEGSVCVEGLTPEECVALFGTVVSSASCDPDPCGGACCVPELDACTELGNGCGQEGDPPCPDGFTCVGGICERLSVHLPGQCPDGTVFVEQLPARCVDGLSQLLCDNSLGVHHPGRACAEDFCEDPPP